MIAWTPVECPSCGSPLREQDVSPQTMAGRCPACQTLVDLRSATPSSAFAAAPAGEAYPAYLGTQSPSAEPLPVPLPAGIHVEERGRDLTIVRRWFSWMYVFLLFFCVFWNGFLVFWYSMAFMGDAPLAFKLFPLLHVAAGVFITYMTIAGFLNRTTFTIERDHLVVRHGPVPWKGNLDVSTLSLQQLFCTEKITQGRNGTTVRYGVEAVLRDGRHLRIAGGLDQREQALFIEQAIEKHLGIQDQRVRSEMAR